MRLESDRLAVLLIAATAVNANSVNLHKQNGVIQSIIKNAEADSIDLYAIPNLNTTSILEIIASTNSNTNDSASHLAGSEFLDITDVHSHCVPDWFRSIAPITGGSPTPSWNLSAHLNFMTSQGISRAILAFSSPGANVYPGNQAATLAIARLIHEQSSAYAKAYPHNFTFYGVVPLPYTKQAIVEARYALDTLDAAGIALYSNFEGRYLGDAAVTPFFEAMNARGEGQIIYVHPTTPYLRVNGELVDANPTIYSTGNIEFFFETARTIQDLAVTQTILNFTNVNYIIPHVGGAFPSVADRLLRSFPTIYNATMLALQTRFYWDSAGPTYFHQVAGLLAYEIPKTRLLFGTDFPYAPIFTYGPSLLGIKTSPFVRDADRRGIFTTTAQQLFGDRLPR